MNKRRKANEDKLQDICKPYWVDWHKIDTKEKYGRFDIWWCWVPLVKPSLIKKLQDLEDESYEMCQTCWKKSKQYWASNWWMAHYCLKHFIILTVKRYIKKLILTLKL